jgi:hypothetical protein
VDSKHVYGGFFGILIIFFPLLACVVVVASAFYSKHQTFMGLFQLKSQSYTQFFSYFLLCFDLPFVYRSIMRWMAGGKSDSYH